MLRTREAAPRSAALLLALLVVALCAPASAQDAERLWVDGGRHRKADLDAPLRGSSIATLAGRVSPAVVNVIVSYATANQLGGLFEADGWRNPTSAQGSGFIIHPNGYVLTNNHVIEGADAITVRLHDDREFEVDVVGIDPQTDVALLEIRSDEKKKFPTAVLGDSDDVRVGDNVLAIGNPLGLSHTVTAGIVSALERRDLAPEGREVYAEFIQTDASINPGNSGGPLISLHGEVIGINTAVNREGQGIGFAIPINTVKALIPHLHKNGYVVRTWLGIRMQEISLPLARSFGLDRPQGALVTEVIPGGPADKAGILPGDVIMKFGDKVVRKSDILPWLASTAGVERPVEIDLLRKGKMQAIRVALEEQPNQRAPSLPAQSRMSKPVPRSKELGIQVKPLGDSLARQLGVGNALGVVVTEIADDSPARASGLRQRDVVQEVGETPIGSKADFEAASSAIKTGDVIRLKVVRAGRVVYIAFER